MPPNKALKLSIPRCLKGTYDSLSVVIDSGLAACRQSIVRTVRGSYVRGAVGISYNMVSVAGTSKKSARVTSECLLDTGALLEYAESANGRLDQPADSSLDWIDDPPLWSEAISPRACYPPDEVIAGIEWLKELAIAGDRTPRQVLKNDFRSSEPYSVEGFLAIVGYDIENVLGFCRHAKERKERVILVAVT